MNKWEKLKHSATVRVGSWKERLQFDEDFEVVVDRDDILDKVGGDLRTLTHKYCWSTSKLVFKLHRICWI